MQKFVLALALVAALVGLSAAKRGFEDELEFGHEGFGGGRGGLSRGGLRGGRFGGGHGHLGNYHDDHIYDELSRRGHHLGGSRGRSGHGGGFGGGLGGIGEGGIHGGGIRRGGRIGRRSGIGGGIGGHGIGGVGGLRRGGLGVGGVGGVGGAGFRGSESEFGALNAGSHDLESGFAEGGQAGLIGGRKDFDAGQHFNALNDQEGLHKHQVINSDKTIIKDRTTGVNDVDSFHNRNGFSQGSHLGDSEAGLAAGIAGGRIGGERDSGRHIEAVGAERAEASGIAGGLF